MTGLVLTERYELVYPGTVLLAGLAFVIFSWRAPPGRSRTAGLAVGILAMAAAGLIALVDPRWAPGLAALAFLVAFGVAGFAPAGADPVERGVSPSHGVD